MSGCPDDLFRQVYVFEHALQAYQIHFPEADHRELLRAMSQGEEIETLTAMGLLGRKSSSHKSGDRYILATHRRGIFVVTPAAHMRNKDPRPDLKPWNLVTYLRFQAEQEADAIRMWPSEHAAPAPVVAQANPPEKEKGPLTEARHRAKKLGLYPLFWNEIDRWGPSHAPRVQVQLTSNKGKVLAVGEGDSNKDAAYTAAKTWLEKLDRQK